MSKELAIISNIWPEPGSSAGGARLMQLISLFHSNGYKIKYYATAAESEHRAEVNMDDFEFVSTEMNSSLMESQLKQQQPDLVIFDRFMVEEQFSWKVKECCPNAIRIIETIDIHCLRKVREKLSKTLKSKLVSDQDVLFELKKNEETYREIAAILRSDLSLVISKEEYRFLVEELNIPEKKLLYLPFKYFNGQHDEGTFPSFEERIDFVSIGNFKHPPNRQAVRVLKREIFPLIKKKLPTAKMHIYGAYAEEQDLQLNNKKEGFLVHGRAGDAIDVVKKARVSLAPLQFGAGIKGKLIESMICETPSVTTSIGAEGMTNNGEWGGYIVNDFEEFAESAVELHEQKQIWLAANQRAKKILEEVFSTEEGERTLFKKIAELKKREVEDLFGAMLNYHGFKANKYFSKWIQEKNKE